MSTRAELGSVHRRADALVADFLESTAGVIHRRVGPVAGVAVSTIEGETPRTLGASTAVAAEVDAIQFEVGVGPCLEALRVGVAMWVPDLGSDVRWGDYGPRAAAKGAASCFSVPLLVHDRPVAVFKVYASERNGLTLEQRETATMISRELAGGIGLAVHLTSQALELDDLTASMTNRRVIDLALGVLMERAQVTADVAFGLLRTQSQQRNVKLHKVAAEVVSSVPGTGVDDLVPHFNPHG